MYKTIVAPIDHSRLSEQALSVAAALARRDGAQLHLITVAEPYPFVLKADERWAKVFHGKEQDYLNEEASAIQARFGITPTIAALSEAVVPTICGYITKVKADIVVMTTHGRTGFSRVWLGSVADGIARHAPVPVLMLRPLPGEQLEAEAEPRAFQRVLIPVDGSPLADQVVDPAVQLGASLTHGTVFP